MRYLLTSSLYSDWFGFQRMESKTKQDIMDVLCKKPKEKTAQMQDGIDFENEVRAACEHRPISIVDPARLACVTEVADVVRGGLWQEKVYKEISICGMDFLLYGLADVIKRDHIYDVKFTKKYEIGKYQNSIQHLSYMFCSNIPHFAYLPSDGQSVWREDYSLSDKTEVLLRGRLASMIENIMADHDMKEAYLEHWRAKE